MTAAINRLVLDLSHHNDVTSWVSMCDAGIVGIIHKASEGNYNTDPTYLKRRDEAQSFGLLWGAYHFGTSDSVHDQVRRFLSSAEVDADTLVCLDLEDYNDKSMSLDQARQWVEEVEFAIDRPGSVVLYSGNRIKELLGDKADPFWGARRLWLAQYGDHPTVQASWSSWWLWQYSDGLNGPEPHDCPGVSGEVDSNSFDGTISQLREQWSGAKVEPAPTPPAPAPGPTSQKVVVTVTIEIATTEEIEVNVQAR